MCNAAMPTISLERDAGKRWMPNGKEGKGQDGVLSAPRNSCKSATMLAKLASVVSRLALLPNL